METLQEPCYIPACGREDDHNGVHRSVEESSRWRPCVEDKQCSRKGCRRSATLQLNRRQRRRGGTRDAWWSYCPEHNYGRVVEGGRVFFEWRTE